MDDQYLTTAYQGETLGSRKIPSAGLNSKSRRLTITPKVNPSSNTTKSKHLNLICKEASKLAEINAEQTFRRFWEDNSWIYDSDTQSPAKNAVPNKSSVVTPIFSHPNPGASPPYNPKTPNPGKNSTSPISKNSSKNFFGR